MSKQKRKAFYESDQYKKQQEELWKKKVESASRIDKLKKLELKQMSIREEQRKEEQKKKKEQEEERIRKVRARNAKRHRHMTKKGHQLKTSGIIFDMLKSLENEVKE
ncbi:hypothetical protein ADUPG1_009237 [Aduncisulcus paluster]|uniref:rRNA-processing protein FYV7 n=2 Tax=Aduncisulcus paluster TaxID=2918883 RepID=A0ABQ5KW40_9EUKA|nr:hypothetical protein ADUPG1_009237 [Aduncisulcus paluster]